jgi:POT family proton-dependent oligopeptide transporter
LADQYWGRYLTIQYSICFALVGHVILIVSALPSVIATPNGSIAAFAVGIIIMGLGTGGFKSNVSALIAEQYKETAPYVSTDKKGNKVIVDPAVTVSRIYIYFYFLINCGSLTGSIAMVYAERLVGFWLSFLLPTIIFIICPMVLFACKKQYTHSPPTGSVMAKAWKLLRLAFKGRGSFNPVSW